MRRGVRNTDKVTTDAVNLRRKHGGAQSRARPVKKPENTHAHSAARKRYSFNSGQRRRVRRHEPITRTGRNQPLAWVQYCAAGQRPHQQQKGKKWQTRRPVGEESHRAFVVGTTDRCMAGVVVFGCRFMAMQPGVQLGAGHQHVEQQHQCDAQHRSEAVGQRRLAAGAGHRRNKLPAGYQSRQEVKSMHPDRSVKRRSAVFVAMAVAMFGDAHEHHHIGMFTAIENRVGRNAARCV